MHSETLIPEASGIKVDLSNASPNALSLVGVNSDFRPDRARVFTDPNFQYYCKAVMPDYLTLNKLSEIKNQ